MEDKREIFFGLIVFGKSKVYQSSKNVTNDFIATEREKE